MRVLVAYASEHGATAAPIAKYVMETYFAKQEGRPLPRLEIPAAPAGPVLAAATAGAVQASAGQGEAAQ